MRLDWVEIGEMRLDWVEIGEMRLDWVEIGDEARLGEDWGMRLD